MKKKLMIVLPSMAGGGAEKVALLLMRYFDKSQFDISLVLFKKEGEYLSLLPEHINIFDLGKQSRFDFLKLIRRLRRALATIEPDVILSFLSYTNTISIIAAWLESFLPKLIISQRGHPSMKDKSAVKRFIYRHMYCKARRIIAISKGLKNILVHDWKILPERIRVINNPVDIGTINLLQREKVNHSSFISNRDFKVVISVGRLEREKNHFLLLLAFKKVTEELNVHLVLIGQGSLEQELKNKARKYGIENRVHFVGFQANPYAWLRQADLFVLCSDHEGFGNVIIEAMACGVPVISTDCPYGPAEIISDSVNGILVKPRDVDSLAEKMKYLLSNPDVSKKLALNALESVKKYNINIIAKQYEEELLRVIDNENTLSS